MAHVPEVASIEVFRFQGAAGECLFVHAAGEVASSGWSGIRLSPRFYAHPPADGLWEFDFEGHPSGGPVLEILLPASASYVGGVPTWFKGVRVYAAQNSEISRDVQPASLARGPAVAAPRPGAAPFRLELASFEDGITMLGPYAGSSLHMKKLRHTLTLTVEGPDEAASRRAVADATAAGLVANIAAAYAVGGGALAAAVSVLIAQLDDVLGSAFHSSVNDHAEWIEWNT